MTRQYWITFRIFEDAGYADRYKRMVDTINEFGSNFWDGPASFIAIESPATIGEIAASVKAQLGQKDLFVIREITRNSVRYIGDPGDGFDFFFPNAKKV